MSNEKIQEIIHHHPTLNRDIQDLSKPFNIFGKAFEKIFAEEKNLQFVKQTRKDYITLGFRYLWDINFCRGMLNFISVERKSKIVTINLGHLKNGLESIYKKHKRRQPDRVKKIVAIMRAAGKNDSSITIINPDRKKRREL